MPPDPRMLLWQAREAADDVMAFVADVDLETYSASRLIHSAVERKLQIVGEALSQLRKLDAEIARRVPLVEHIIGFRNVLVPAYAIVEHERVWSIARHSVPPLRTAIGDLLRDLDLRQASK